MAILNDKNQGQEGKTSTDPAMQVTIENRTSIRSPEPMFIQYEQKLEENIQRDPKIKEEKNTTLLQETISDIPIQEEYRYAKLGLILGFAAIIGGVILGINGVVGSTSWSAKLFGLETHINDAAPGVVLFIVGLFMIIMTIPRIKIIIKNIQD